MISLQNLIKATQINAAAQLWEDRAEELACYFGVTRAKVIDRYRRLNLDMSLKMPFFFFKDQSDSGVIKSYQEKIFVEHCVTRFMLHYNRIELAYEVMCAVTQHRMNDNFKDYIVIDYGCGAADYALSFAVLGSRPVLVDVDGGPLSFASSRFQIRHLQFLTAPVTLFNLYPDLPRADLIIAAEMLELVNDPPVVISNFANSIQKSGYLYLTNYPVKPKVVSGPNLRAASEKRTAALEALEDLFTLVWSNEKIGYIYQRR